MTIWRFPSSSIFHGFISNRTEERLTIRLAPGVEIEVTQTNIEEIEEATDKATHRTYVRVKLKKDAEFSGIF